VSQGDVAILSSQQARRRDNGDKSTTRTTAMKMMHNEGLEQERAGEKGHEGRGPQVRRKQAQTTPDALFGPVFLVTNYATGSAVTTKTGPIGYNLRYKRQAECWTATTTFGHRL